MNWLGSVVGLKIVTNEDIKLGFSDREVVGTTLGAVVGVPLGAYVDSELVSLEGFTGGSVYVRFEKKMDQWIDLVL